MISFRHHIVTLVAVFGALAVGIVLGGGPLSDVTVGAASNSEADRAPTAADRDAHAAEIAHSGEVARTLAATALAGRLTDRPVAVVRTADADPATAEGLVESVVAAGGEITGTWTLQQTLFAPSEKTLVDTMGSQLATQLGEAAGGAGDASTYVRIGQLLGRAIGTTAEGSAASDAPAASILGTLEQAGMVAASEGAGGLAPLVLVVLGDGDDPDHEPVLQGVLAGLATGVRGLVVAAPTESGRGGNLADLRASDAAVGSTVDGAETDVGRVTTVLALVAAHGGLTGDFGASGSDGTPSLG